METESDQRSKMVRRWKAEVDKFRRGQQTREHAAYSIAGYALEPLVRGDDELNWIAGEAGTLELPAAHVDGDADAMWTDLMARIDRLND